MNALMRINGNELEGSGALCLKVRLFVDVVVVWDEIKKT